MSACVRVRPPRADINLSPENLTPRIIRRVESRRLEPRARKLTETDARERRNHGQGSRNWNLESGNQEVGN